MSVTLFCSFLLYPVSTSKLIRIMVIDDLGFTDHRCLKRKHNHMCHSPPHYKSLQLAQEYVLLYNELGQFI